MKNKKFSSDFRDSGDKLLQTCCDGLENFYDQLFKVHKIDAELSVNNLYFLDAENKHPYEVLGEFFLFIHVTYVEKYKELLGAFIESINHRNFLIAALAGRSLIESTATLRFYNQLIFSKVKNETFPDSKEVDFEFFKEAYEIALRHMKGSRFDWQKFFTSNKKIFASELVNEEKRRITKSKDKKAVPDFIEAQPISKCLDAWFMDDPELVALSYNFFCDLVHPNLGSNLLLTGINEGNVQIGKNSNRAIGKSISREAVTLLTPSIREAATQLANSVLLSSLGQKVNRDGTIH
jgi:hypothetical protein